MFMPKSLLGLEELIQGTTQLHSWTAVPTTSRCLIGPVVTLRAPARPITTRPAPSANPARFTPPEAPGTP
eukprot:9040946-Heterocapsa_arctica.AAC.1